MVKLIGVNKGRHVTFEILSRGSVMGHYFNDLSPDDLGSSYADVILH